MNAVGTAAPRDARLGLLQVSAAGVLWGTGGLVVTLLHRDDGLGAMTVSGWRMALGSVALVLFASVTARARAVGRTLSAHPVRTAVVGCGTALYQGLYFVSVLWVGVSVSTVIALGLAPILAAIWEHGVRGTRPPPRELAVLCAALAGLVLISETGTHAATTAGAHPTLGLVLAIAAGVTYAATTVLGHTLAQEVDPVALTTCATAAGTVALSPFLIWAAVSPHEPLLPARSSSLALLLYLGVATMALAYGLLYAGLRTTSGAVATVATLVEPLSAAALAAIVLGERLSWPALLGGALILLAVAALRPTEQPPVPA
jgi:DME family drug/metabolite transporter